MLTASPLHDDPPVGDTVWHHLPIDLSLCILRRLRAIDLVAACQASAAWRSLCRAEALWQHACMHRWPHTFDAAPIPTNALDAAVSEAPFVCPPWVATRGAGCRPLRRHPHLSVPPPADAEESAWRRFYLENDAYEVLNLAPALLEEHWAKELLGHLRAAQRWCSPLIGGVAAESRRTLPGLDMFGGLRHLTIALPPPPFEAGPNDTSLAARYLESLGIERVGCLRSLWVSEMALGEASQLTHLLEVLRACDGSLHELDLSEVEMGSGAGLRSLADAIKPGGHLSQLRTLCLAACKLGDAGVALLCPALRDHPTLTELDLTHNTVGWDGAAEVGRLLLASAMDVDETSAGSVPPSPADDGAGLRALNMSHNPLGQEGIHALTSSLGRGSRLRELGLHYVNGELPPDGRLDPFPLTPLLEGSGLRALDMSYNYIGACGQHVDTLRDALAKNTHLHTLDLRRCCIGGWRRARAIARGLAKNTAITDINLGYNGLGAASQNNGALSQSADGQAVASGSLSLAVEALCEALQENGCLRRVSLAHNQLGDHGAYAVLQAATRSRSSGAPSSITALDLRSNSISISGLLVIAGALRTSGLRWLPAAPRGTSAVCSRTRLWLDVLCPADFRGAAGGLVVDLRHNATLDQLVERALESRIAAGDGVGVVAEAGPSASEVPAQLPAAVSHAAPTAAPAPRTRAPVGPPSGRQEPALLPAMSLPPRDAQPSEGAASMGRRRSAAALCPHYMLRQEEVNPKMRRILVDWLVELYEELLMPTEALLAGVYHVDRFLSSNAVKKETLQLVGAVALMLSSNSMCKLPGQDGERIGLERALNSAQDIEYWTDNTYSVADVSRRHGRKVAGVRHLEIRKVAGVRRPASPVCVRVRVLAGACGWAAEGRGEGWAEGRGEGWAEGRGEGRAEGRGEGRAEGQGEGRASLALRVVEDLPHQWRSRPRQSPGRCLTWRPSCFRASIWTVSRRHCSTSRASRPHDNSTISPHPSQPNCSYSAPVSTHCWI